MANVAGLLRLLRWPGAVTAAANAATGFLLMRRVGGTGGWTEAIGVVVAGALVYLGGVVLNDVADAKRDEELHPERPIPSGQVTRSAARTFSVSLLALGCAMSFVLAGSAAASATGIAALAAVLYDVAAKRWRVPGSLMMAMARGGNASAGVLASAGTLAVAETYASGATLAYPIAIAGYTFLLTFASTFEGKRPGPWVAGTLALVLVLPAALAWPLFDADWWWAPALALIPLAGTLISAAREAQYEDGPGIGAIIRNGVFGFLLVDATFLMGVARYDPGFWLILTYVAMRFLLARLRS